MVAVETATQLSTVPTAVYVSTNSGASWTATTFSNVIWGAVACSADGRKLVAAAYGVIGVVGGAMYSSSDSGVTWALNGAPSRNNWVSVASSADGTRLVAASGPYNNSGIYISTNSGATWVQTSAPVQTNWVAIVSSADGNRLAAAVGGGVTQVNSQFQTNIGLIYVSTNGGLNWSATTAPSTNWHSIASSADGSRLAATVNTTSAGVPGAIYVSTNSGYTWTKASAPLGGWDGITSSADGLKLLAGGTASASLYTSVDGGATWISSLGTGNWNSVASSADGSLLLTTDFGGHILASRSMPHPAMRMSAAGGNIALSWLATTTNFVLQSSAGLGPGAGWSDVTATPVLNLSNLEYQVVLSPTNSQGFYRLESR